ncbi:MAG: two-component regulator propeller domain-containing protein [Chitinophagaceae bacterium]
MPASAFNNLPIGYIGIENGLSNNTVRCIYQDKRGFMWFGTTDGLNRYDGYDFKVFRNKLKNNNSLVHNIVSAIAEDKSNYLWIGTRQGVSRVDDVAGTFTTITWMPGVHQKAEPITAVVRDLKTDSNNNVFIGTEGLGLLLCKNGSTNAVTVPLSGAQGVTSHYGIHAIEIDIHNRVWVLVQNHGLGLYDAGACVIKIINATLPSAICLESDGDHVWVGAADRIYQYSIRENRMTETGVQSQDTKLPGTALSLLLDKTGQLWVGTFGSGISIWNMPAQKISRMQPGDNKNALAGGAIYAIYEDRESRKWIGSRAGINVIEPRENRFRAITHEPGNASSLSGNVVSAFYEAPDGNLWVGTDGDGLNVWNRKKNIFTVYAHAATDNKSISGNFITSIIADHKKNTWIASFTNGIDRFDSARRQFKHYNCINPVSGKENKVIFTMYEDADKQVWAAALRQTGIYGALYRYNTSTDNFEAFDTDLSDFFTLNEDRSGNLWGGNLNQLVKIDKINRKHQFFATGHTVRVVHEDKLGNLWVGTEGGGLLLFDRKKKTIAERYTTDEGLCNNVILSILEDSAGNLWMSTYNGLSKFNISARKFSNYDQGDGLSSKQFYFNAALALRSGEMVFGSIKGFTLFNPGSIGQVNRMPALQLTGIQVNNAGIEDNNSFITSLSRYKIESLQVPYDAAVFSFNYTALEYSSPNKITYAYFMEGWDRKWNYSENNRTATYTHINEGSYTLRIKCTNAEGLWNPDEIALKIVVLPPWYRTWWAYMMYSCLAFALVYFYYTYKIRQTRLRYQLNIAHLKSEKEQAELSRERAEHQMERTEHEKERLISEKEKEMNDKRLSFFTDISHEFRTPLTLIINPIKDILRKSGVDKNDDKHELNIVQRNARRLLSLLDQLLLFRKADSGADTIKPTRLSFYNLSKDVYLCFIQQAKSKQVEYLFECNNENLAVYADREKMEIILYNLISNALKYTPAGGKVSFAIRETDNMVIIQVADNGYGIPAETGEKLFEKFYRVQGSKSAFAPGFGIGLYLVKYFTEAHEGTISYQSEPGNGTCFTIEFPKEKLQPVEPLRMETATAAPAFLEELAGGDMHLEEDLLPQPVASATLAPLVTEKQKMLVIDDDMQMRHYIVSMFNQKFAVYEAGSGEEGMATAEQYEPDIIITDIKMEGMNGIELCKAIKINPSLNHIPVILLTGTSSADTKLEGVEGGADDYITKPFEKELLVARVTNLLKSRSNLQKYFFNEITLNKNSLKISAEYKEFLEKCISIVEQHLDDDVFTIRQLAAEIGMSHSTVYKKIRTISGQSLNSFIRFIRLRKAAELFINTNQNVNEVAFRVGINDARYFREQFNKLFGMNPSEYIKKFRRPFDNQYSLDRDKF